MRLRKDAKIDLIKSVPLFSHCTRAQLAALAAEADQLSVREGTTLTQQGERGREFVVLVDGAADVVKNGRTINRLGPGDFLGEIALISGAPRTATVTTTTRSTLLVLTDRAYRRASEKIPAVQARLLLALSERLQADAL
jgi:CRP-like cAMP-binding protein